MSEEKRSAFLARIKAEHGPMPHEDVKSDEGRPATVPNYTLLQAFEWYVPNGGTHWKRLTKALRDLKETGIDNMWIPPACKASSPEGNGYDIYDLYDLGEFDAKGSRATKWGTKEDLKALCDEANKLSVGIYFDAVLNHKAAADHTEKCRAIKVDNDDRNKDIGEPYEIEAWLGFDFEARGDKYSKMKYHWEHFTGTDFDKAGNDGKGETAIFRILGDGKSFAKDVDTEKGNFDYLMFADVDHKHPAVKEDVLDWGVWVANELNLRGFRFDAIKHFSEQFLHDFVDNLDEKRGKNAFLVGEFWKTSLDDLCKYLENMKHKFNLFDAPLVSKFHEASTATEFDLRGIFDDTLIKAEPYNAVTLVMNHDTQPGQMLETPVTDWFVPLAYALILLRIDGYPCVFYGDIYGLKGGVKGDWREPSFGGKIPDLVKARKIYAYGEQNDYFDEPNLIGWVRTGTWDRPDGCAVVMSNAKEGQKKMFVGEAHKGEVWTDVLDDPAQNDNAPKVTIEDDGHGIFPCGSCQVRVFVNEKAFGRDGFGKFDNKIYEWDLSS